MRFVWMQVWQLLTHFWCTLPYMGSSIFVLLLESFSKFLDGLNCDHVRLEEIRLGVGLVGGFGSEI